jgi:hypothetical protein
VADAGTPKDWFEFMRKTWNGLSFTLPGMMTPTANIDEINKKSGELRTLEAWLAMNSEFIGMTIKTLEMQKAALESLRDAADAMSQSAAQRPAKPGKRK